MCTESKAVEIEITPEMIAGEAGAPILNSGQAGPKGFDNAADAVAELHESFEQRLTLDNPRLIERYLKSELRLLVHFLFEGTSDYIACFQRAHIVGGLEKHLSELNVPPIGELPFPYVGRFCSEIHASESRPGCDNHAVFVDIVKPVERPEIGPLTSCVWFESADGIDGVLPHALYFSPKHGFKLFGRLGNRKTRLIPKDASPRTNQVKLLGQMVEGTSKVIEGIASDHHDSRGNGVGSHHVMGEISCLRIALGADFVWVGAIKGLDCRVQVKDVFVGPFSF
jgi:hypothetical protein